MKEELELCDAYNKEELYRMVKLLISDVKIERNCRKFWQAMCVNSWLVLLFYNLFF